MGNKFVDYSFRLGASYHRQESALCAKSRPLTARSLVGFRTDDDLHGSKSRAKAHIACKQASHTPLAELRTKDGYRADKGFPAILR